MKTQAIINTTKWLSVWFLIMGLSVNTFAQDRNNDDEVITIAEHNRHASVLGDLLVKFNDNTTLQINQTRGQFSTGIPAVDAVLSQYEVRTLEKLLPNEQPKERSTRGSAKSYTGADIPDYDLSRLCFIQINDSLRTGELIEALNQLEEVEFAEPNYIVYAMGHPSEEFSEYAYSDGPTKRSVPAAFASRSVPNDPMYAQQWGIPTVHLPELWQVDTAYAADGSDRPIIAILDTGVDPEHPDLAANIWTNPNESAANNFDDDNNGFIDDVHGWDFVNQTGNMHDFNSHGTHCAGIAAAVGNNGIGICGANPNAWIMPIAVLQSNGSGDVATIIRGVNYAKNNGADVLSMSFGSYSYSIAFEQALAQAYQSTILVGAAGNDDIALGPYLPHCECYYPKIFQQSFPGAFTFVLGVEANTCWSNKDCDGPNFSRFSEEQLYNYELKAPGSSILSTVPHGGYRLYYGTSMSTPLVAGGISALIHAKHYPSKELLFGDLINTSNSWVNFYAAYSIDPATTPAQLQCVTYHLVDSITGDGDTRIDAGETVEIYPVIRTTWGATDSITCWIDFDEFEDTTTLHFVANFVDFGHTLSSYGKSRSTNPIVFTVDSNVVDGRYINLVLKAISPNAQDTMAYPFTIVIENGVELRGMITQDMTLYPNVHYIVTDNLGIASGATLTIKPGTTLKFKDNASFICEGRVLAIGTPDSMITFTKTDLGINWKGLSVNGTGTFDYCIFDHCFGLGALRGGGGNDFSTPTLLETLPENVDRYCFTGQPSYSRDSRLSNSIIKNFIAYPSNNAPTTWGNVYNCIFEQNQGVIPLRASNNNPRFPSANNNIVNNISTESYRSNYISCTYVELKPSTGSTTNIYKVKNNFFNNSISNKDVYLLAPVSFQSLTTYYIEDIYFGTSKEDILREHVIDFNTPNSGMFYSYDFSNMAKRPHPDAHGIVWKVLVNGHDAQDEFDQIAPLGIGRHKFEIWFNRPMDKDVTPMVAMGVRPPYTQVAINKDGFWNKRGDIYTVFLDLDATIVSDGLCRIYVANAKDDEHFEIPYENKRFNVQVASAGSMSANFMATPGIGKIDLEWNNNDVNFDDFLGYNMYRYRLNANGDRIDSMLINTSLILDTLYTDYNVVPGERYYYYYRVLRSSLTESDDSKIVSAVPLTATAGDANGSFNVDVTDIVSIINFITGQNPQPFIFDAADVNGDGVVNVLDIVSIINIIMNPGAQPSRSSCATATYFVDNGTLYVDAPVDLGGLQINLNMTSNNTVTPTDLLANFERVTNWMDDDTYMFMAYSMSGQTIPAGRHALLNIGNATIESLVLADQTGCNVVGMDITSTMGIVENDLMMQMRAPYPNPFNNSVHVPYAIGSESVKDVEFVVTDLMGRVIDIIHQGNQERGEYEFEWLPKSGLVNGVYFIQMRANNLNVQTSKVVLYR